MKILIAEYAVATGLGGTYEIEGRAMLSTIARSFVRCGHRVVYPTSGPVVDAGVPVLLERSDLKGFLSTIDADAGLIVAPDPLASDLIKAVENRMVNLGSDSVAAQLCADKLECTLTLKRAGVPVADVVESPECGCNVYVVKPRYGCGSDGVIISSFPNAPEGYIATRYLEGVHLSVSFIRGRERFLPLTINRQIIEMNGSRFVYAGGQVPYRSPRADEIWEVARRASDVLGLKGYAGIDLVVGDLPRVVDVNARLTTSIVGCAKVLKWELADLILRASFGGLPESVEVDGEITFRLDEL
ncbi:MAG: ATP-grasp domain-containing protein [Methanothrix sp.]|uniref:ATP-grasp domain-containing protein n=1 Tax=Methanothrix sp. TaxID=90426 RepID=UPI0025DE9EAB|nr:ATP-grasp domain-containing protein [Methanothrix sp.]MCQ8902921.1 ATP-grasp domain-containing protein [Methanothrix sp.]